MCIRDRAGSGKVGPGCGDGDFHEKGTGERVEVAGVRRIDRALSLFLPTADGSLSGGAR